MQHILFIQFGKNNFNNKTIQHLLRTYDKINITTYDVLKEKTLFPFDELSKYDALIIGGSKKSTSVLKLIQYKKKYNTNNNNPIDEIFHMIYLFNEKPILGFGYGCQILALYYGCDINKLEVNNRNKQLNINIDQRYLINKNINKTCIKVTFNNSFNITTNINDNEIKTLAYISNTFEPIAFKFMFKHHYGFLFRLIDSQFGITILDNFICKILF